MINLHGGNMYMYVLIKFNINHKGCHYQNIFNPYSNLLF